MSSLVDAVLNSENDLNAPTPGSTAGAPQQNGRSSSRPRGPPSDSVGPNSEANYRDDEMAASRATIRRTAGPRQDIPKVVDVTGEVVCQTFEEFLEK